MRGKTRQLRPAEKYQRRICPGMSKEHATGRTSHAAFDLYAHLVFVTKYRHRVLSAEHLDRLQQLFRNTAKQLGVSLVEFNGESDHVHLLISYPPTISLSDLARRLKGSSSRALRLEYPDLRQHYWRANALWSPSYYVTSAGGAPLEVIRRYIQNQDRPSQ